MAELRDLYDINSNKTNKTYRKGESIPNGYYPMVVMVVIRNSKQLLYFKTLAVLLLIIHIRELIQWN